MARIPQPRELAELKGSTRKNPQRYREDPVKSEMPLGTAPDHLNEVQKACWFEIEAYAAKGVLTGGDRIVIETLSVLLSQFRTDPEGFPANKMTHMISLLARIGMTPADRQKVGIGGEKETNPFDGF